MIHAWAGARWYSAEKRHADTVDVPLSKAGVRDIMDPENWTLKRPEIR